MKAYTLNGMVNGREEQMLFASGERATAMAIAREWLAKGRQPFLYEACDGKIKVLLNFRNFEKKAAKKAA